MELSDPGSSNFDRLTARFGEWLQSARVTVSSKIKLADLRHRPAGRAVVATQDIPTDEELFSIPRASILTTETSALPTEIKRKLDDSWLSLILVMVYELKQGSASKWAPYFDILPEEFETLMYWTETDLQNLEGSAVVTKIGKKSADKAFMEQVIPAIRENPGLFGGEFDDDDALLKLCHRMGSIIMAYAFDLERTSDATNEQDGWEEDSEEGGGELLPKGMVPLADMLNADADRNNAKLFYEDDRVVMKTIKYVKEGEELFNDYGPLPSADVLRRYGYVTEMYAQYDVVEVYLDLIKDVAKDHLKLDNKSIEGRTAYLEECGILDDGYDITRSSNEDGQFSDEMWALLNTLTMPQEDFDRMQKKQKMPKPELSKPSAELLYSILVRRRSHYPSSTDALDMDIDERSRRRQSMARQVIEGEKQVLGEAAESIQAALEDSKKRKAKTFEEEAEALRGSSKEAKTV